jgi:hypothetical protein
MAVENIFWWPVSDFYEHGGSPSTWSLDVNILPQTVYAYGSLSSIMVANYDGSVFCGIASYFTRDPKTGFVVPHLLSVTHNGVAPGIFDNNVSGVSFGYGAHHCDGDCTFQIFGFG